ncbi:UNVERIFIED_CONTAM: hypothetical protein HDU68_001060 [Siphonaria sp. JEL0065]|nr:hypothetical protein HDU68_001060 [Siphonaria sp. JEL0065]
MPETNSKRSSGADSSSTAGSSGAPISATAPLITGSSMVHMYTRIRRKQGNTVSYRWVTHLPQIVTAPSSPRTTLVTERSRYSPSDKPQRSLILQGSGPPADALSPTLSSASTISPSSPASIRNGRTTSHDEPRSSSETSPLTPPSSTTSLASSRRTRSDAINVEGIYGASFAPRSKSQKPSPKPILKSPSIKSPSSPNTKSPSIHHQRPRPQQSMKSAAGSIYGHMLDPLKPTVPISRPPLPPTLSMRDPSKISYQLTPPVLAPRQNSPPTPTPDQPIAFHLKASIDQFTTTTTVPIPTSKVNDLAKRGAFFYFLEIQHQILMHEWNNMHDGYGVIKMAQNPFGGGSSSGATAGPMPVAPTVASWNTITFEHLKAHHPTAPTRLNYLPPTIHLAMPNGRDVGALVQWAVSHDFEAEESQQSQTLQNVPVSRLPPASKRLVDVLNDPYDAMPQEIRFLHLVQTANRLGMTDAASLSTLATSSNRPESMYFTLSEAHFHFPIYTPLSSWMLENWSTSYFSHPHFPTLWHHPTSGIDESLVIRMAILFQQTNNSHAALFILRNWAGANDSQALKALANRVADVATSMHGVESSMSGQALLHGVWESVHAMENERDLVALNALDGGLEAGEREILELEEWAKESMGQIEQVVDRLRKKDVEGLVEYQRKENILERRENRVETYDSDATVIGESASEDDGSPTMQYGDVDRGGSRKGKGSAESLRLQVPRLVVNENESESLTPPKHSPPPPPTSSYYDASSLYSPVSRHDGFFVEPEQEDRVPSDHVLNFLNKSSDQTITVEKHDSQDIEELDDQFSLQIPSKSPAPADTLRLPSSAVPPNFDLRQSSFSTTSDVTSILTVSSCKSTALFNRVKDVRESTSSRSSQSVSLRPESVWTVNDHTRSGFFDDYYNQNSSTRGSTAPPSDNIQLGDWGYDEDEEPSSPIELSERAIERWVSSVAFWEYSNWKKEARKMKSKYVELPSNRTELDECMKVKESEASWEDDEEGLMGVGAGPFGGTFEEDDDDEKNSGFTGILKRFKSVGKSAAGLLEGKSSNLGTSKQRAAMEQEFCWDEGLKGGEVDGDVIVASVIIVRDAGGHIVNSTIYPRRL